MIKKYGPLLILVILTGVAGAYFGSERTVIKERSVEYRTIVETRKDGTRIVTREKIKYVRKTVHTVPRLRRYHIRLQTGLSGLSIEQIGLGYALTNNVALEASYGTQNRSLGLGLIVRF